MEAAQNTKNTDCYFYYYSTCSRENCPYRHEPSSRGCEVTCLQWKEGKCTNPHCNLRHMEIKKKRSEISCYWETQPCGCLKAHCPFMHRNKDNTGQNVAPAGIVNKEPEVAIPTHEIPQWTVRANHEALPGTANAPDAVRRLSQTGPESYGSPVNPVEPVIVTFEEESDSESTQSTPTKTKVPKKENLEVLTVEEIRLAEIQAEQAAYWENVAGGPIIWNDSLSVPTTERSVIKRVQSSGVVRLPKEKSVEEEKGLDFKVLTLEEIRRNRQALAQKEESIVSSASSTSRPSVMSRLGVKEEETDSSVPTRRLSSTTEVRRTLKRVQSSIYVSRPIKRVQYDASSGLLDDTDDFIKQIDEYLAN